MDQKCAFLTKWRGPSVLLMFMERVYRNPKSQINHNDRNSKRSIQSESAKTWFRSLNIGI